MPREPMKVRPFLELDRVLEYETPTKREYIFRDAYRKAHRVGIALKLPPSLAMQESRSGVCWPEFGQLDWRSVGLDIEARPTVGDDRIGITGTFCAIAETGTLVLITGEPWPVATALLPDTHFAVVRADRIVSGMEEAFALIRTERSAIPRAINLISGPSRTGDIEQTIVLGAHGPYRVHILVL